MPTVIEPPDEVRRDPFVRITRAALSMYDALETEEDREFFARRFEEVAYTIQASQTMDPTIARWTEGRTIDPLRVIELEARNRSRLFQLRRRLLAGALSAIDVAELLGTSRQTPHDRVRARTLIALEDNGALRFPAWQFDAEGKNGVIDGLPEIWKTLVDREGLSILQAMSWLNREQEALDGRAPLNVLKAGDPKAVATATFGVGGV